MKNEQNAFTTFSQHRCTLCIHVSAWALKIPPSQKSRYVKPSAFESNGLPTAPPQGLIRLFNQVRCVFSVFFYEWCRLYFEHQPPVWLKYCRYGVKNYSINQSIPLKNLQTISIILISVTVI